MPPYSFSSTSPGVGVVPQSCCQIIISGVVTTGGKGTRWRSPSVKDATAVADTKTAQTRNVRIRDAWPPPASVQGRVRMADLQEDAADVESHELDCVTQSSAWYATLCMAMRY